MVMDHNISMESEEAVLLEYQGSGYSRNHVSVDRDVGSESSDGWINTLPDTPPPQNRSSLKPTASPSSRLSSSESWLYYQTYLPRTISLGVASALDWIQGPRPARPFKISHTGPSLTRVWSRSRRMERLAVLVLVASSTVYLTAFGIVLALGHSGCRAEGHENPVRLSCVDSLWPGSSRCGLDGQACRPFHNSSYAFRCPADCSRVKLLEPYTIGDREINYRTLVIGGPRNHTERKPGFLYRGDSFICPAAIHAGVIPDFEGGLGIIDLTGEQGSFPSISANGIESLSSVPAFPLSFSFRKGVQASSASWLTCKDPRWVLLGLTILYNVAISIISPNLATFYVAIFTSAYFCVALAADAPEPSNYSKVVSLAFQGFLPATFIAYVIYRISVKRALHGLSGAADQTVLWLGSFWVGALDNLTFDRLPLRRLIPYDITTEPGAGAVLIGILIFLIIGGAGQVWAFRLEGRLLKYLLVYLCLAAGIGVLIIVPNLNLRIHHYIVALILLPSTAIQTRPSLVYQGLLFGLFVNGVARWGFASILEASEDLFQSGLSGPAPHLQRPQIVGDSITFSWANVSTGYDSLSILVNDVERFRGYEDHDPHHFSWIREQLEPAYFRFAYVRYMAVEDVVIGDYSKPGTWFPNGTWLPVTEADVQMTQYL